MYGGEIVLVAGDTIDLKWDPAQYPGTEPFVRWELYRSPKENSGFYEDHLGGGYE